MSFRNKSVFFIPFEEDQGANAKLVSKAPLAPDAGNIYMPGAEKVVRILVGAADLRLAFSSDKAVLAGLTLATDGVLLLKNSEYFVSSGIFKFMRLSAPALSVELTKDRG